MALVANIAPSKLSLSSILHREGYYNCLGSSCSASSGVAKPQVHKYHDVNYTFFKRLTSTDDSPCVNPTLPIMSPPASPPAAPRAREPSPPPPSSPRGSEPSESEDKVEPGEVEEADSLEDPTPVDKQASDDAPPLPQEPVPGSAPPLPQEPAPEGPPLPQEEPPDDGWDCQWDPNAQSWFFYNRFTGMSQWENPRLPSSTASASAAAAAAAPGTEPTAPQPSGSEKPAAGGYNPAIHGDYDPNAWYAQGYNNEEEEKAAAAAAAAGAGGVPGDPYGTQAQFNRFTGQFQTDDAGPGRHTDDAKSRRQMNAFFDVDAAANAHDGRSLKAERSNKKPSKTELKAFKEKRRARKEEKRRAWLRD